MSKGKSFVFGFVAGGIAAGVTVLLSTPKPGREIRYDVKNKWDEANIKLVDMKASVESIKDSVSEFTKKGIPTLQSTARDMKTIVNTWKDDIQPSLKNITHGIKELDNQKEGITLSK